MAQPTVVQAWSCGLSQCTWEANRTTELGGQFDQQNSWLIRGNNGKPSVNVIGLSFLDPSELWFAYKNTVPQVCLGLPSITGICDSRGVRWGMATARQYFRDGGVAPIYVIGGITYTAGWNTVLSFPAADVYSFGAWIASNIANVDNVGIEIDYEESSNPRIVGLRELIKGYRSVNPFIRNAYLLGNTPSILNVDVGQGTSFLSGIAQFLASECFTNGNTNYISEVNWANGMEAGQSQKISTMKANWASHINGATNQQAPMPPARFTGALWLVAGKSRNDPIGTPPPECINYATSKQKTVLPFVQGTENGSPQPCYPPNALPATCWRNNVATAILPAPPAGVTYTTGMLGYSFWAAENPTNGDTHTWPLNMAVNEYPGPGAGTIIYGSGTCENGLGGIYNAFGLDTSVPANVRLRDY